VADVIPGACLSEFAASILDVILLESGFADCSDCLRPGERRNVDRVLGKPPRLDDIRAALAELTTGAQPAS
jgi:hypothetical protein